MHFDLRLDGQTSQLGSWKDRSLEHSCSDSYKSRTGESQHGEELDMIEARSEEERRAKRDHAGSLVCPGVDTARRAVVIGYTLVELSSGDRGD